MTIAVGSTNPVKVAAARAAFAAVWPNEPHTVTGVAVPSGVAAQPMGDEEAIRGARTRARNALAQGVADFGVGFESGLQEVSGTYFTCGWAVVLGRDGREGIGSSLRVAIPPRMLAMIREGMELGDAEDCIFQCKNAKHDVGYSGLATDNAVTRMQGCRDGAIAALAPFIHPEIFASADAESRINAGTVER